jgi:hypothetical protein
MMGMRNARIGPYRLVKAGNYRRAVEWTLQQVDARTGKWGPLASLESIDGTEDETHAITLENDCTGTNDA